MKFYQLYDADIFSSRRFVLEFARLISIAFSGRTCVNRQAVEAEPRNPVFQHYAGRVDDTRFLYAVSRHIRCICHP